MISLSSQLPFRTHGPHMRIESCRAEWTLDAVQQGRDTATSEGCNVLLVEPIIRLSIDENIKDSNLSKRCQLTVLEEYRGHRNRLDLENGRLVRQLIYL